MPVNSLSSKLQDFIIDQVVSGFGAKCGESPQWNKARVAQEYVRSAVQIRARNAILLLFFVDNNALINSTLFVVL
jgi:hypothetical protein